MKRVFALILVLASLLALTACGGSEEPAAAAPKSADLEALYATFQESMGEMMVLDSETVMNFQGIDAADCVQCTVALSTNGMITDEIWLIEAKDAEALARIQTLADNRMKAKADETVSYAPDQYAVVQKGQILVEGNYLAFLVAPEVDALKAAFEAALQ